MKLFLDQKRYIETANGIDLSIPIRAGEDNVNAWYCPPVIIEPVKTDQFIGDVNQGGVVNFKNITLNPHGNGTHTECVGHISSENYTINKCLKEFHFEANLITIEPKEYWNKEYESSDAVITESCLKTALKGLPQLKALIIRTAPNSSDKKQRHYSNTNPPYFTREAMEYINQFGVMHLLVDLPSIDREVDGGKLEGHRIFWNYPKDPQINKTITELIYVPDNTKDGEYLLNIGIASLESDAAPSKIVIYELIISEHFIE